MSDEPLSHLDEHGHARMVDVGPKDVTSRRAVAELRVVLGEDLLQRVWDGRLPKGDVLAVARVAGIQGAKRCSDLIPLCHPLPLQQLRIEFATAAPGELRIECEARCEGRTGVEMEAMTGCAVAGLTVYDMCKAVSKGIRLEGLRLLAKEGGKSGAWRAEADAPSAPVSQKTVSQKTVSQKTDASAETSRRDP